MSFVHTVHVGFFGTAFEPSPGRSLQVEECVDLLDAYNKCAPGELRIEIESPPKGNPERGFILGHTEGIPIGLKRGVLICPCLSTSFILSSIALVAFAHRTLGCSIYSYDEGRFLTLQEFVPNESFSDILRKMLPDEIRKTL
jgi:hypothetical protein